MGYFKDVACATYILNYEPYKPETFSAGSVSRILFLRGV